MGISYGEGIHALAPTYGLQFHPESFLSEQGIKIGKNFAAVVAKWQAVQSRQDSAIAPFSMPS